MLGIYNGVYYDFNVGTYTHIMSYRYFKYNTHFFLHLKNTFECIKDLVILFCNLKDMHYE